MRIIVTSDTHSEELPLSFLEDVKASDLVIHVGDFCNMAVFNQLQGLKDIRAVYGNMDGLDLRRILPRKAVFACENIRIGLFHGEGGPNQILDKVKSAFEKESVDVVIFGHSHEAFKSIIDGVLFFNPGSLTDNIRAEFRSYGVLQVNGKEVKASIVRVK